MSDEADIANEIAEEIRIRALQRQKEAPKSHILAQGYCLNPRCGEEFEPEDKDRLYCDGHCADEHAHIMNFKRH